MKWRQQCLERRGLGPVFLGAVYGMAALADVYPEIGVRQNAVKFAFVASDAVRHGLWIREFHGVRHMNVIHERHLICVLGLLSVGQSLAPEIFGGKRGIISNWLGLTRTLMSTTLPLESRKTASKRGQKKECKAFRLRPVEANGIARGACTFASNIRPLARSPGVCSKKQRFHTTRLPEMTETRFNSYTLKNQPHSLSPRGFIKSFLLAERV